MTDEIMKLYDAAGDNQKEFIDSVLKGYPIIAAVGRGMNPTKPEQVMMSEYGEMRHLDLLRCLLISTDIHNCDEHAFMTTIGVAVIAGLNKGMNKEHLLELVNTAVTVGITSPEVIQRDADGKKILH